MSYHKRTGQVKLLINDLRHLNDIKKRIAELDLEIEEIKNKLYGISKSGVELTKEQADSSLPLPRYRKEKKFNYDLIVKKDMLVEEQAMLKKREEWCKVIELLNDHDRRIVERLYFKKEDADEIGHDVGYTKKGLYSYVNKFLDDLIKEVTKFPEK